MSETMEESQETEINKTFTSVLLFYFGIFLAEFILGGCLRIHGVYFLEILDLYENGPVQTSLIFSTFFACSTITSLVFGPLGDLYPLKLIFIGTILGMVAEIIPAVVSNFTLTLLTLGVINGVSNFLTFIAIIAVMNKVTTKYTGTANGFFFATGAAGVMTLPSLAYHLATEYGSRGMFLIFGGIYAHCIVAGFTIPILYKSSQTLKIRSPKSEENVEYKLLFGESDKPVKRTKNVCDLIQGYSVFIQSYFISFCILTFCASFALTGLLNFIPEFIVENQFPSKLIPIFMLVYGINDVIFRFLFGLLLDIMKSMDKEWALCLAFGITGAFTIALPLVKLSDTIFYIYAFVLGTLGSLHYVAAGKVTVEHIGKDKVGAAFGIFQMLIGIAGVLAPLILGYIKHLTGSCNLGIIVCGLVYLVGTVVFSVEKIVNSCK